MSEDVEMKFTKQELDLIDYCLRFTFRIEQNRACLLNAGYPIKKEIENNFTSILNKINTGNPNDWQSQ